MHLHCNSAPVFSWLHLRQIEFLAGNGTISSMEIFHSAFAGTDQCWSPPWRTPELNAIFPSPNSQLLVLNTLRHTWAAYNFSP
jgi:hypothetical protein